MTGVADAEELRRLLAEAERYRRLVETPRLIPWELELATWRFTYVGPQALTILGYPLEAWYQPGFWPEHIHPADRDAAVSFCISSTEAGKDHEFEYRMVAADGRAVWLRDLVSVVKDRAGRPVGLRGVMLDVTAEKEADRSSRLSEQRFRDFAEVSSDWFWETGEDHAYTWVSDTTEAKLGMVPEWFIGRRRVDIANTALDPDAWAEHKRRLAAHEPYS
ncbi:MAG: PAS domain-containing protein, partial [Alphaproteobacteria bacterium]